MADGHIIGIVYGLKNRMNSHTQLSLLCIKIVIRLSPRPVIGNIMSNKQAPNVTA